MKTKTVEKTVWMHKQSGIITNNVDLTKSKWNEKDLIEGKALFEVEAYNVKLIIRKGWTDGKGKLAIHLVNTTCRVPYITFSEIISKLKASPDFSTAINWDIYKGQPVYEFFTSTEILKDTIEKAFPQIDVEI